MVTWSKQKRSKSKIKFGKDGNWGAHYFIPKSFLLFFNTYYVFKKYVLKKYIKKSTIYWKVTVNDVYYIK